MSAARTTPRSLRGRQSSGTRQSPPRRPRFGHTCSMHGAARFSVAPRLEMIRPISKRPSRPTVRRSMRPRPIPPTGRCTSAASGLACRARYARGGVARRSRGGHHGLPAGARGDPGRFPDRPGYLNNLGNGLRDRYARGGALADLEAAIAAYRQAVEATPADSPDRPTRISTTSAMACSTRYARTRRARRSRGGDHDIPAGGRGDPGRFPDPADVPT